MFGIHLVLFRQSKLVLILASDRVTSIVVSSKDTKPCLIRLNTYVQKCFPHFVPSFPHVPASPLLSQLVRLYFKGAGDTANVGRTNRLKYRALVNMIPYIVRDARRTSHCCKPWCSRPSTPSHASGRPSIFGLDRGLLRLAGGGSG